MSHLSIERLAALADEQPSAQESSHLAQCAECARELDAIKSLVTLAGAERQALSAPLTQWDELARRLRAEGLMTESGWGARESGWSRSRALLQLAAAVLLMVGGMAAGRLTAGASALPEGLGGSGVVRAAGDSGPAPFTSAEEAERWQQIYADGYQRAIAYLAAQDSATRPAPAAMRARLAALDRASQTMREALHNAPWDPVINDFYLNSFAQREATLRQLTTALPQGVRLSSF